MRKLILLQRDLIKVNILIIKHNSLIKPSKQNRTTQRDNYKDEKPTNKQKLIPPSRRKKQSGNKNKLKQTMRALSNVLSVLRIENVCVCAHGQTIIGKFFRMNNLSSKATPRPEGKRQHL